MLQAFRTRIRLQQNATMEQFARRPLTRRHHFPQHTAFLLREGNAKFGHGKSPSPQTTLRSEKENRPGSTCQSKIAKLLACCRGGGPHPGAVQRTPALEAGRPSRSL